jgi:hypothetical protein
MLGEPLLFHEPAGGTFGESVCRICVAGIEM